MTVALHICEAAQIQLGLWPTQ